MGRLLLLTEAERRALLGPSPSEYRLRLLHQRPLRPRMALPATTTMTDHQAWVKRTQAAADTPRPWYHWRQLYANLHWLALATALALLVADCAGGTTHHEQATVVDRRYHEAYWSTSLHTRTTGTGKNQRTTYYTTRDYHPPWWEVVVQDGEGTTNISCSEGYYCRIKPQQQVPVSYRRGRWSHCRWATFLDED